MRIHFGPEHDSCHIDPSQPGGYEWWYFDAISDDGRWAIVSIYFLGSPMSPYYKAVIDGRRPEPSNWSATFFSLHEKVAGKWRERAYAYNVYTNGQFSRDEPRVSIGASTMQRENEGGSAKWKLTIDERALWWGKVTATLRFTSKFRGSTASMEHASTAIDMAEDHTWVCVAPQCRVDGAISLASGKTVSFSGDGYHDHNFGQLPFEDTDIWYWGRATVRGIDGVDYLFVYYDTEYSERRHEVACLIFDANGKRLTRNRAYRIFGAPTRNAYGFEHRSQIKFGVRGLDAMGERFFRATVQMRPADGILSEGPFYRRLTFHVSIFDAHASGTSLPLWNADGEGICEVFRPARLCGPIASRAMWSRMRRRRS